MMDCNSIIPKPKIIQPGIKFHAMAEAFKCLDGFGSARLASEVAALAGETGLKTFLELKPVKDNISGSADPEIQREAYRLSIREDRIEIHAGDERGAFYGLKTLRQLLAGGAAIRTTEITDWPDLKMRGFHITLGDGYMPVAEYAKKVIANLSNFKLNTLVLEYDNRFPWRKHHGICHPNAYTRAELQSLLQTARDNFIEVIPLLDSLGHAERYLIHKEYAHLKELPDHISEMCASNPATLQFMQDLWSEVLEFHPDSRYAHITGDEVFRQGGFCPECQKYADKAALAKLFTKYYSDLSRWIIAQGRIPIIWGDMLLKYPEDLAEFPRDIMINDWRYCGNEGYLEAPCGEVNPEGVCDEARKKLFERYWRQDETGRCHPYPYFKFFKDKGFKCIAGTAASEENGGRSPLSSFKFRFENNKTFASTVLANHGEGVLITYWNNNGPVAGAWQGIAAGADFSWHVREERYAEFMERFVASFLGQPKSFADKMIALDESVYHDVRPGTAVTESAGAAATPLVHDYMKLLQITASMNLFDHDLRTLKENIYSADFAGESRPLDLSAAANSSVANCMPATAAPFRTPSGEQKFCGIKFYLPDPDAEAYIRIAADEQISPLKVNAYFDAIAFFSTAYQAPANTSVASMKILYGDGASGDYKFVSGVNTADWWGHPKALPEGIATWSSYNEESNRISGYMTVWQNPHPEKRIVALEFRPLSKSARLVVLGVSGIHLSTGGYVLRQGQAYQRTITDLENRLKILESGLRNIYAGLMPADEVETALKLFVQFRSNGLTHAKKLYNEYQKKEKQATSKEVAYV